MTDERPGPADAGSDIDSLPEASVRERNGLSIVWVIPIVAALVGAFLVYKALSERGPEVTITFSSAEGLEAGKTKVKYKDVEVGVVESIDLAPQLDRVVVTAELRAGAERYLTDKTRFWVVRARVSAAGVSGLGTVFSGAYIGIDPSTEGEPERDFVGLEVPPVVTSDEAGRIFHLEATELGSIDVGSPVYYRWIKVGQVVAYDLSENGTTINMQVFVREPHDTRITTSTRFWNASGLDVKVGADGLQIDTPSVISMLIGGVAFDDAPSLEPGEPVSDDFVFPLYKNKQETLRPRYTLKRRFLLHFDQSVSGLEPGAPVEFRGIQIGEVADVRLVFDESTGEMRIPVLIDLEPERLEFSRVTVARTTSRIDDLVKRGMRAHLKTANLVTGQMAVEFDMDPEATPAEVLYGGAYPELPTTEGSLEAITTSVARIVDNLEKIPFDQIGGNVDKLVKTLEATIRELQQLAGQINKDVAPSLTASLEQLEATLTSANALIRPGSTTQRELERLMLDLSAAVKSIRLLADHLEQNPEDLLRGRKD